MNKRIKLFTVAVVVVLIATFIITVNYYLSDKHLFVYSTGTSDKAFLNATWKMSRQEIERANKTTLHDPSTTPSKDWRDENPFEIWHPTPEVLDQNRFNILVQKNVHLFGHPSEVVYYFFDNMLYGYQISLKDFDFEEPHKEIFEKPHKEILETLRKQFGAGKEEMKRPSGVIYSFNWDTEKQTVSYWMEHVPPDPEFGPYPSGRKDYSMRVWSQYKPFFKQIEDVAKNEKKTYF